MLITSPTPLRIGILDRRRRPGRAGGLADRLVPPLLRCGARVDLVRSGDEPYQLDVRPRWDVVVLRAQTPAALHLAAACEAWGISCVNTSDSTRLAQDKLASTMILRRAGLPVPPSLLAWLPPREGDSEVASRLAEVGGRRLLVKAASSAQGSGVWSVEGGKLRSRISRLQPGPYLLMEYVEHQGHDLKVFAAGQWMAAIERPFPATTHQAKLGSGVDIPQEVADVTRRAGDLLGLVCYGCDFVLGPDGWWLVDINAFPGYKGVLEAPERIADQVVRLAGGRIQ